MLISVFFETVYRVRKLRGGSPNTVRLYRFSIRHFDRTLGRAASLSDFSDDNVVATMQSMLDRGCSPYTANKERSQLLALWRFACKLGTLTVWPTVEPEREPVRVPIAWMADDIHVLLSHVATMPGAIGNVPCSIWWRAIILVCLDTGERIGAVSQVTWDGLDREWLLAPAEVRKGRKRDRRYLLSADTLAAIDAMRRFSLGSQIFFWPYCRSYLWVKFSKLLKNAGLPHGPKDKFHRFRKTVASVTYAAGMDAQDILDHDSKRTTQKYLDPRFTRENQASAALTKWLKNPPNPQKNDRREAQ